jgi:hypothetical protein
MEYYWGYCKKMKIPLKYYKNHPLVGDPFAERSRRLIGVQMSDDDLCNLFNYFDFRQNRLYRKTENHQFKDNRYTLKGNWYALKSGHCSQMECHRREG